MRIEDKWFTTEDSRDVAAEESKGIMTMIDISRCLNERLGGTQERAYDAHQKPGLETRWHKPAGHKNMFQVQPFKLFFARTDRIRFKIDHGNRVARLCQSSSLPQYTRIEAHWP